MSDVCNSCALRRRRAGRPHAGRFHSPSSSAVASASTFASASDPASACVCASASQPLLATWGLHAVPMVFCRTLCQSDCCGLYVLCNVLDLRKVSISDSVAVARPGFDIRLRNPVHFDGRCLHFRIMPEPARSRVAHLGIMKLVSITVKAP